MSNELAIPQDSQVVTFELVQRQAKALSLSSLVPDNFKNNIPNCIIALEMASRMDASPMAVMQNIYIVHGKPSWSSQFIISCINSCGKFSPLRFEMIGGGDDASCFAWALEKHKDERMRSNKLCGPPVSIAMAKKEGWFNKNGSKWQTMPDLMLRYRAATFFGRLYCPEMLMGMHTQDEIEDIKSAQARTISPPDFSADAPKTPKLASEPNAGGLGEIIDDE